MLRSASVAEAFEAAPRDAFVPEVCASLARLDVPVPLVDPAREAVPSPSPRLAALLLEALELEPGHDVLVRGVGVAWLAALAGVCVQPGGSVRVAETAASLRSRTDELLGPHEGVRLARADGTAPGTGWDRVLVVGETGASHLPRTLADGGQLVRASWTLGAVELARVLRRGDEVAELGLTETRLGTATMDPRVELGARAGAAGQDDASSVQPPSSQRGPRVGDLLHREGLLADAWTRSSDHPTATRFRDAVEETMGPALERLTSPADDEGRLDPAGEPGPDAGVEPGTARAAWAAFHNGYVAQFTGELDLAVAAYGACAEILPTAEAYTFRGWAQSMRGDPEQAIEDCQQAIEIDPTLGNPYNDIGAYLIELDRPEDAVSWLEDATDAERYASPHFPWLNLGRAYLMMNERDRAREALETALRIEPGCEPAEDLLERLDGDTERP